SDATDRVERLIAGRAQLHGRVVIAGGGQTGFTLARSLLDKVDQVQIIERDRGAAESLSAQRPELDVIHGDATDIALMRAERVAEARAFVAVTGNDERNLLASLLADELGIEKVITLVQRTETTQLWNRLGKIRAVSPRRLAAERIQRYIDGGYSPNIASLRRGSAQILERTLASASPAAGCSLAEIRPPRGMIVGAVVRGKKVFVPRGGDRLEVGDTIVLFVQDEHLPTVQLLFPGREPTRPRA
ncbi:MAG: NAD-binding protein, partial [Acidobacteriota bacterium]